jgi:hypothetical protein
VNRVRTSPNGLALNAVISHFVNSEYNIRAILLRLREIISEHSDKNIRQTVVKIIYEFQLDSGLSAFILNNAESNDTAVYYILNTLEIEETNIETYC